MKRTLEQRLRESLDKKIRTAFLRAVLNSKSREKLESNIEAIIKSRSLTAKAKINLLGEALLKAKGVA